MASGDIDWNPGNSDPDVGSALDSSLHRAIQATPRGSPARTELKRRQEWLWLAVGRTEYGEPTTNWWDGPSNTDLSSSASRLVLNGTLGTVNLTHGCFPNKCDGDAAVA